MVYENVIAPFAEPSRDKLLPDIPPQIKGREKPTLVISLDGTLVESQWTRQYGWRYIKRPGLDDFLRQLAPYYELVLWTDCLSTAETVIDRVDPRRLDDPQRPPCIRHRLYRDATTYSGGMHRKDLGALNRDLTKTLIIDCDSRAYCFQPEHGMAVSAYNHADDPNQEDRQLTRLVPFLAYLAIAHKLGTVTDFAAELQSLQVSTNLEKDNGADFKAAVERRFAELRAAGKMPVLHHGRVTMRGAQGPTLWSRMGLGQRPAGQ